MALLRADVRRILEPGARTPASDRAPDWVADGTPEPLRGRLIASLGAEQVATRALDLVRYASDASPYRSIPRAVVIPRDAQEVARLFSLILAWQKSTSQIILQQLFVMVHLDMQHQSSMEAVPILVQIFMALERHYTRC